ncbi:MAG: hypothetical protein ABGZ53_09940, partial [Fuerstiella sp.]
RSLLFHVTLAQSLTEEYPDGFEPMPTLWRRGEGLAMLAECLRPRHFLNVEFGVVRWLDTRLRRVLLHRCYR